MILRGSSKVFFLLLSLSCLSVVVGCGKKSEDPSSSSSYAPALNPSILSKELEEKLNQEIVICGLQGCPDFLVKVLVVDGAKLRSCTGFLTDNGTVATTTTCLPDIIRFQGQSCENEVFFLFPATSNKPAIRAGCQRVLQAARIDKKDPSFWRENIAFLQIDTTIYRRSLKISREGLEENRDDKEEKRLWIWKVNQKNTVGIIDQQKCSVAYSTWVNPLGSERHSPTMIVGDCTFEEGNSGAPIVDRQGRVRGIAMAPYSKDLIVSLQKQGYFQTVDEVVNMIHVTNMSCIQTIDDDGGRDQAECLKYLDEVAVNSERAKLSDPERLIGNFMQILRDTLSLQNDNFLKFNIELSESGNPDRKFYGKFSPKCFVNPRQWNIKPPKEKSYKITVPYYEVTSRMDKYTRLNSAHVTPRQVLFEIKFYPRDIQSSKVSTVSIKSSAFSTITQNVPVCP